ncbi:MAG: diguanylate cyclase [wastewater metagenome]|nr:diguanylate cyclase [Candidatus Loosdrechtia aerotolerans]
MKFSINNSNNEFHHQLLFENNPHPMWIFDQETLAFLDVNNAAILHYGYSREEFFRMTIQDLHPAKDIPYLFDYLSRKHTSSAPSLADIRRHRKKNGSLINVEITKSQISFKGKKATLMLAHDITERWQVEQRLNMQYSLTRILAESDTIPDALPKIIQALCESMEWDAGMFWVVNKKTDTLHCTETWHRSSVKVQEFITLSHQTIFPTGIELPGRIYTTGKPCWITDFASNGDFSRAHVAAREGLHGAFGFPVRMKNEIFGILEFFSHRVRHIDEHLLILISSLGNQISQFIERKQAEASLNRRIDFEKTVACISTRFIIISDFSNAISTSLADIGQLSGASRAYLFQLRNNGTMMDNTHEWCNENVTPEIQNLQNLSCSMFPWWMGNLQAGNVIHITDVSGMPPEAAAEKEILEKQGIKSLLSIPVYAEKRLAGFLGFDNTVNTGMWSEEDFNLLHITAAIIGTALARRESEKIINHMAYHDSLTKLPNRILFQNHLQVALTHARRNKQIVAVMILDLDNFKTVNDTFGHLTGDSLLIAVAERLAYCVRKGDTIARMGGDEFMIILPELNKAYDAAVVAQKILILLYQPFQLEGHQIHTTASIGISLYPSDSDDTDTLIKQADIAMYLSKKSGKKNYRFYKEDLNHPGSSNTQTD